MNDYRFRPPVDGPRVYAITRRHFLGFVGASMFALACWYMVAVVAGVAFR